MREQTTMTADEINRKLELLLFGDDLTAKTDEQIDRAIMCFTEIKHYSGQLEISSTERLWHCRFFFGGKSFEFRWPYKSHPYLWHNRTGQSWQQTLEQHIRDYRRSPRDFCGTADGMMLVLKALTRRHIRVSISWDSPEEGWIVQLADPIWGKGSTGADLPMQVALAAVVVMERDAASVQGRAALAALEAQDA